MALILINLKKALKIVQNWRKMKKLMINSANISAIIFTGKYKFESIEPL